MKLVRTAQFKRRRTATGTHFMPPRASKEGANHNDKAAKL